MNGVHQVGYLWQKGPERSVEVDEYVGSLPTRNTDAQKQLIKRSRLIIAFRANAPDTRYCRSKEAKQKLINDFVNSKRWRSIVNRIMK
jgi:hypothetical protein